MGKIKKLFSKKVRTFYIGFIYGDKEHEMGHSSMEQEMNRKFPDLEYSTDEIKDKKNCETVVFLSCIEIKGEK